MQSQRPRPWGLCFGSRRYVFQLAGVSPPFSLCVLAHGRAPRKREVTVPNRSRSLVSISMDDGSVFTLPALLLRLLLSTPNSP